MPLLDAFARDHARRGWQVLGIAVDQPQPVRDFLQRQPVGFPIALAGMEGVSISRDLGNAGGQLPYSVVFDASGRGAARHLGAVDEPTAGALGDAAQLTARRCFGIAIASNRAQSA